VAEIQSNINKRGKRNKVSRMFHAKDDKEAIAAWRLDLNRILHVFNVRSVASARSLLTVHPQTELAINTNVAISDVRHKVVNTHTVVSNTHVIVSELQRDVASARAIVSDIHRTMVENREGIDGNDLLVGVTLPYFAPNQYSPFPRLKAGW